MSREKKIKKRKLIEITSRGEEPTTGDDSPIKGTSSSSTRDQLRRGNRLTAHFHQDFKDVFSAPLLDASHADADADAYEICASAIAPVYYVF